MTRFSGFSARAMLSRLPSCCRLPALLVLLALGGALLARPARAQVQRPDETPTPDDVPRATGAYAIEDARVVVAPGDTLEGATVVVRDGLIEAVGRDVGVPYDAAAVEGDTLVVHAGFISGLSHAGISRSGSSSEEEPDVKRPGAPPPDVAGLQADRSARALLDPEENTLEDLRAAGFTAAHTVPRSGMLPGQGAVIQLAGDSPSGMVLRESASVFAQFEGAGQVYPATDMAVIATMRQLLREAERRQVLGERYEEAPQDLPRPRYDDLHAALSPVLAGDKPIFFFTDGALGLHRATRLHEELGFPLAMAGLQQSFAATETLTEVQSEGDAETADVPLFLSLALPEEPDDAPDATPDTARADSVRPGAVSGAVADTTQPDSVGVGQDTTKAVSPQAPGSPFIRDYRTRSYEDTDGERENLLARRGLFAERYYANAATLEDAGLQFGFSTKKADAGDIHANLRKMIEYGLSEEDALAALTTDAARLLGLSRRLGTVEEGKIANLVVTDGALFEEDTAIRHVFVDGEPFEYDAESAGGSESEAPPAEDVNPAGTWEIEISAPGGTQTGTLTLEGAPGNLSGTIVVGGEEQTLDDVELSGSDLSFEFDGGRVGTLSVTATIEGDTMEGSVTVPGYGGVALEGTRISGPE
jgi:imidazolonepropionase-like amidohydrolase